MSISLVKKQPGLGVILAQWGPVSLTQKLARSIFAFCKYAVEWERGLTVLLIIYIQHTRTVRPVVLLLFVTGLTAEFAT